MNKLLSAISTGLLIAGLSFANPAAFADTSTSVAKKTVKKKSAKKAVATLYELAVPDEDDTGAPIDAEKSLAVEYKCEFGNVITIFHNEGDEKYIALRWQKVLTRMQRVGTTTGAHRFENKRSGLVWIGIPAKGMLLDAKSGHQLANECKDKEQMAPTAAAQNAPKG